MNSESKVNHNKKVAIIGSGPAGITLAFILAAKGYDITIFETNDKIGGVLRYGIPDFRLPRNILDKIEERLRSNGVKIKPNCIVVSVPSIDDLFRDGYKAVFIGTGVWSPKPLGIKGETFGNVHYAIDYLKSPSVYSLGKKVCVIGAGNVAMDVARTALRKGANQAFVMYRKGEEDMSASNHELEYAKVDGVEFEFYKSPIEITEKGVKYIETKKVEENGEEKLVTIEGSEGLLEADSVIIAAGQRTSMSIYSYAKGIELNEHGLIKADEFGRTTRPGIFASGDVVTGARTVVEAVKFSKTVANSIDEYISTLED